MVKSKNTFTTSIRAIVSAIKKGQTMSYAEVARQAGNPRAARAVAMIMSKNYDPKIPCHRVIRSDGGLGGYNRGGIDAKRTILHNEGAL